MNVSVTDESEVDGSDALRPASNSAEVDLWERVRLSVARLDNAGRRQREPEFIAHKMAERAKAYRQPLQPDRRGDSLVFLGFSTARQRYAVAIDEVLEIEPLEHFCAVPQVPAFIRGVIQWRGTILTLVDLGQLFSIPQTGIADVRASVIIEAAGKRIAVAAGEIEEILNIATDQIMVPPDLSGSLPAASRRLGWPACTTTTGCSSAWTRSSMTSGSRAGAWPVNNGGRFRPPDPTLFPTAVVRFSSRCLTSVY